MLVRMGDMIWKIKSHQSVLNDLLVEYSGLRGLRVKVFRKGPDNEFPGGVEFHNQKEYMKEVSAGMRKPYIFHTSW